MSSLDYAKEMDQKDPLKDYKSKFSVQENIYYMDGNSLGLCSVDAKDSLIDVLNEWSNEGIKIWGSRGGKFYNYPQFLGEKMSKLINARPEEVVAMGSITSNLHQLLATFYHPTKTKYKILVDELNFPSDIYAVKSILELKGQNLEDSLKVIKSHDGKFLDEQDIIDAMDDDVAIALLPSVLYRSAQVLDMDTITAAAHKRGVIIGWDLAHGIGAIPYDFSKSEPDFAVWCTYKYLNGGPGSTAGLYVNRRHFGKSVGLKGWFGCTPEKQFVMSHNFCGAEDARAFLQGTHSMLAMAPLEGSLDMFLEAGMDKLREKSLLLTDFLVKLIEEKLLSLGFTVGSPLEHKNRGGHIALEHDDAYQISIAMRKEGVIPDFRDPNVIRLAPVAFYVGFEDVYRVVEIIEKIAKEGKYKEAKSDELVY
ncbi:MAG: kynureninase [Gudongella sp.]|nr:kynureninase [Gudongella sp.]